MKKNKVIYVEADTLSIKEGFNVRYDYGNIDELSLSIKENGVKVPLRVYKGDNTYILVDGHRRLKAIQLLNDTSLLIPVIVDKVEADPEKMALGLIVYNDGKRLTMLEESRVYARLVDYGWTPAAIAKKVGKSQTHIANCMVLDGVSTKIKKKIMEKKIAASLVVAQVKAYGQSKLESVIDKAKGKVTKKKIDKGQVDKGSTLKGVQLLKYIHTYMLESEDTYYVGDSVAVLALVIKVLDGSISEEKFMSELEDNDED